LEAAKLGKPVLQQNPLKKNSAKYLFPNMTNIPISKAVKDYKKLKKQFINEGKKLLEDQVKGTDSNKRIARMMEKI